MLESRSALARVSLGALHAAEGRLEQAATLYEEALRLDPRTPMAHNNLGVLYARRSTGRC